MTLTLTLDDELVERLNKIAVEKATTLDGMVNEYLARVAEDNSEEGRLLMERLNESFRLYRGTLGEKTWTRDDLYDL